jgi:hypothetical protein
MQNRRFETMLAQKLAEQIAHDGVIVDDKDLLIHFQILD